MPAAVTYTFTNTEVADAAKFNTNYTDLVDAVNDFDGGTASNTQRLALPKAGTSVLNGLTRKQALIFYDTDEGKIKVDDGANLKAVGGGLAPVPTDESHSTDLESGKHYLVNCDGAGADITLNLPAGATESDIKVSVYNIPTGYKVIIAPNGAEKIFYNDTDNATVEFVYAETEAWAEFIWNGTKWLVNDNSNVLSGTFSGAMTFTGPITPSGGIVGKTDGVAVGTGKIGEKLTASISNGSTVSTPIASYNAASIPLTPGVWVVYGKVYVETMTGTMTVTNISASIGTTSGADNADSTIAIGGTSLVNDQRIMAFPIYLNVSVNTDVYLVTNIIWSGGGTSRINGANSTFWAVRIA